MKRFPPEFSDLLSRRGLGVLNGRQEECSAVFRRTGERYVALPAMIDAKTCAAIVTLLERRLAAHLQKASMPIPAESITGMREDYSEVLPKAMRLQTAILNGRSQAVAVAQSIGLLQMLRSDSLRVFAERISGRKLDPDVGSQVICYKHGDYVGPHNDHHPESPTARNGFVDVQLTFVNAGVRAQSLIYERKGHLTEMVDVTRNGLISTYFLPFWHFTTPLQAKKGHETSARRWLLLATYELAS